MDPELNRCFICDHPDTACTHAGIRARLAAATPHMDAERTLMARGRTTPTSRTTSRGATPGVSPVQAPTIPPMPPEAAQTPAEGAQLPDAPSVAPPVVTETVLDGDGYEQVMQLSPITMDSGAQTTATGASAVVARLGEPTQVRDALTDPVPEGKVDAATDPQRPRRNGLQGVLVSRNELWPKTGAWTTDPTNSRRVIFTRDIHRVEYQYHTRTPSYMLVGRRGTTMPKPR